jgi:hypothetical protein
MVRYDHRENIHWYKICGGQKYTKNIHNILKQIMKIARIVRIVQLIQLTSLEYILYVVLFYQVKGTQPLPPERNVTVHYEFPKKKK